MAELIALGMVKTDEDAKAMGNRAAKSTNIFYRLSRK
jgi:hypothetical protein